MHRSSSSTRISDELFTDSSSSQNFVENPDPHQLPTFNPQSDLAKREKSRLRSANAAVHFIPIVLVLCAIVLWYFSSPVDMVNKGDPFLPETRN